MGSHHTINRIPRHGAAGALDPAPAAAPVRPRVDARGWLQLLVWLLAMLTLGVGSVLWFGPDGWYARLSKPTWDPPSWIFAPAWIGVWLLLGIAGWLVSREPAVDPGDHRWAWAAFAVHGVLLLAWAPLFFGLHAPGLAFLDVCLLWLALLWLTIRFGRMRPLAGYLMAPCVLWISFVLVLNGTIWLMN